MKQTGYDTVQLVIFVVVLGMLGAGAMIGHSWWESHKAALIEQGVKQERVVWQKRELEQQAEFEQIMAAQQAAHNADLARLMGTLNSAQARFEAEKESHERTKQKHAAFDRGVRDGSIVLVDPGKPASGPAAGSGLRPPGTGASAGGDEAGGAVARGLSRELSGFLWSEVSRADEVVLDLEVRLTLAQDNVRAFWKLATDCHAAH